MSYLYIIHILLLYPKKIIVQQQKPVYLLINNKIYRFFITIILAEVVYLLTPFPM